MAKQHHTLILVPHAHAKLRKWRVTNLQIGLALSAVLLLTGIAAYFTWAHLSSSANPVEIARLKGENEQLRQVNQTFEASIKKLQTQLAESEDRTRQLAIVAGLETLEGGVEAGIGGGTEATDAGVEDLPQMEARAGELASTLAAVEAKLEERVRWISSTPAISPVRGILTSGFGHRSDPLTHGRGNHQGLDIAAGFGQAVRASADGIVMRAAEQGGYGKAVFLAHGFGITTRYGHLSRIDVKPGQRVKRGDVIGRVGSTGRSTGPHLHYEVRVDGESVNPLAYILDETSAY